MAEQMFGRSQDRRRDRDPQRQRHLLERRVEAGRRAHLRPRHVGIGDRVVGHELQRLEEAVQQQHDVDQCHRPARPERRAERQQQRRDQADPHQHVAEAEPPQDAWRAPGASPSDPTELTNVINPLCAARQAKAELQHHRQQERHRADGNARQRSADHRNPECRDQHHAEIEHRLRMVPRMPARRGRGDHTGADQRRT